MSHHAPAARPEGTAPAARRGLRANSLTLGPVVALGLAYMSLAPAVYFNMGFMEADANGPVMPLIFIFVTIAILPTALSFAALNRRRPSAGSALTWVTESLGLPAGLWAGFLLATLYVCACAIYPAYFAIFFNPLLEYFHADATFVTGLAGGIAATLLVAWMLARNIQLSARSIAIFMAFEAVFVLVFSLYTVFFQLGHGGIAHPAAPLNPSAAKAGFSGLSLAVVFGILSIAGVDSVAPVAEEAKTPKKLIPLATILVTLGAGAFWTISSYGFATAVPVATVEKYVSAGLVTPVYGIAAQYIGGWKILVPITGMTATIASFGASVVCASRLMYSVSRSSGEESRRMSQVHRKHDIPWNASLVAIAFAFIAPVVVAVWQDHNSSSAAGWLGGVFVFFALVAYMMVNLANLVYHWRHARDEFSWLMNGLVPVLGIGIDGYILYKAFFVAYMQESFQLGKSIVFISLAWTLIGAVWAVLRGTRQAAGLSARPRHATAEGDLFMADNADVIVVGAGIAGSGAAFRLATRGISVTHVEKRFPAGGPSGRSGALLHLFYTEAGLSQLAARGIEILRNMQELTGYPSDYREVGMMTVGGGANVAGYRDAVNRIRDVEGGDIRLLSMDEFAGLAPAGMNTEGIEVAAWEPRSGYADPASATMALAKRATELGARSRMNTRVAAVLVDGQRAIGVETTDGERILGDDVILAAGPWTRPLLRDVGVDLPLRVERHIITALDTPGAARDVLPFCWCDDINMSYGRPEGPDLVLFGSWSGGGMSFRNDEAPEAEEITNPDVYRAESDAAEGAEILRYVTPRIPDIATHGIRRGWAGLYDMSPDDLPVIGAVPGLDHLYVIAGSSGHGFKLGPAVGEAVAQLVETGESPVLKSFAPDRFLAS